MYQFLLKGVLGRYIHLMRPFHHFSLLTTHFSLPFSRVYLPLYTVQWRLRLYRRGRRG